MLPSGSSLLIPWRKHPQRDLLVPGHVVYEILESERWRVKYFVSPSVIGITSPPSALLGLGLRVLALVPDRIGLIRWLSHLSLSLELHGPGSSFEHRLACSIGLPDELDRALMGEVSTGAALFSPHCLRWLLAEALAAPPPPFGVPALDPGIREWGELLVPNVMNGRPPSQQELLRAVFLVHEAFSVGVSREEESNDTDWILSQIAATSYGVRSSGQSSDRLLRSYRMWIMRDDHPRIDLKEFTPSWLREVFRKAAGMDVGSFFMTMMILTARLQAIAWSSQQTVDLLERLMAEKMSELIGPFLDVVAEGMSADLAAMKSRIRQGMEKRAVEYHGWGSVPKVVPQAMLDTPLLRIHDNEHLAWSLEAVTSRAARLPVDVLQLADVGNHRKVRGYAGRLFEAYVHDLISSLDPGRYKVIDDQDLAPLFTAQKRPDYVIVNGKDLLIVEVSSMELKYSVARGDVEGIGRQLHRYKGKLQQVESAIQSRWQIARELLNLQSVGSYSYLVVAQEAMAHSPVLSREMSASPFLCGIEEFERLVDLGEAGWSIPLLVARWQKSGRDVSLGFHLTETAQIRHGDQSADRWAGAIADFFDLPQA